MQGKSEHWLRWSWRPALMYVVIAILANHFLIQTYVAMILRAPAIEALPADLWDVIKILSGTAVAARSAEKIASSLKRPAAPAGGAS